MASPDRPPRRTTAVARIATSALYSHQVSTGRCSTACPPNRRPWPLAALDDAPVCAQLEPFTAEGLREDTGLVDFWTYSYVNCAAHAALRQRVARAIRRGLRGRGRARARIGFDADLDNVRHAVGELSVSYPDVIDSTSPSGAGSATATRRRSTSSTATAVSASTTSAEEALRDERAIQQLLGVDDALAQVDAGGSPRPPTGNPGVAGTYVGHARGERRIDPAGRRAGAQPVGAHRRWTVDDELAVLDTAPGSITYRFRAAISTSC